MAGGWRTTACKTEAGRAAPAAEIGAAGRHLLAALDAAADRPELAALPMAQVLRRVWAAQYVTERGRMRLSEAAEPPSCAEQVCSPCDPEARYSTRREADWIGYKAHTIRRLTDCGHLLLADNTGGQAAITLAWFAERPFK